MNIRVEWQVPTPSMPMFSLTMPSLPKNFLFIKITSSPQSDRGEKRKIQDTDPSGDQGGQPNRRDLLEKDSLGKRKAGQEWVVKIRNRNKFIANIW